MEKRIKQVAHIFSKTIFIIAVFTTTAIYGQAPTHLPQRSPEPVGFFDSTENIIFFVVIPIIIAIIYLIWRGKQNKL